MAVVTEFERKHHELLADLIEHVLRTTNGLVRVPDLARETGFSRFHLTRLFKEVTNEPLEGFIRRIRLERAAFMILHSARSIEEIAGECGYYSSEAFSRAFK